MSLQPSVAARPPVAARQQIGERLVAQQAELASALVARQCIRQPYLAGRLGPTGRQAAVEDVGGHLAFLAQAVTAGRPELFGDHMAWAKVMLAQRGVPVADLAGRLRLLRELLAEALPAEAAAFATDVVDKGLANFVQMPLEVPSFLDPTAPLAELASDHLALLLRAERAVASQRILAAVAAGTPLRLIYLEVFQRTQREIGRLWQMNRISVAQEHYCTAATQMIISQLYPHIFSGSTHRVGTLVATGVAGDLHEIGVRMLADLFELDGWHACYLGGNTPTDAVLQTVAQQRAQVLAVSATLSLHLPAVQALIERLRADGRFSAVRVLVGGYPFNLVPGLWQQVGADGHAATAEAAITLARQWVCP